MLPLRQSFRYVRHKRRFHIVLLAANPFNGPLLAAGQGSRSEVGSLLMGSGKLVVWPLYRRRTHCITIRIEYKVKKFFAARGRIQ